VIQRIIDREEYSHYKTWQKFWNQSINSKSMMVAFLGQVLIRGKIIVDNKCLQVKNFKYLGCEISYENEKAI